MWVEDDKGRWTDGGVDGVCHETFTETCDDGVVRDGRQGGQVNDALESLETHRDGRRPEIGRAHV